MAGLSCSSKCMKHMLFILNLIFWMCGAVLFGFGITILVAKSQVEDLLDMSAPDDSLVHWAGATLITVGCLIFFITVLGCCGACKESTGCLTAYSVLLIFVLVLQIVCVALAASLHNKVSRLIDTGMKNSMANNYGQNSTDQQQKETKAWDQLQKGAKCCGLNYPSDWNTSTWYKSRPDKSVDSVPLSCCTLLNDTTYVNEPMCYAMAYNVTASEREEYVHTKGCETKASEWLKDKLGVIVGVTIGILLLQIIVVIMACLLRSAIKTAGASYEHV